MMKKQDLTAMWDHLRQCHGIAVRAIALLPTDKIHTHPIPDMRTPTELVVHAYSTIVRAIPEGVARGEIKPEDEVRICEGIKSTDDLGKFARDSWSAADQAVTATTDANIQASVKTPWGKDMPGFVCLGVTHDELLHHRGQLYVYLRQLGKEPPMMWDFEHNAPEYQPKAAQTA